MRLFLAAAAALIANPAGAEPPAGKTEGGPAKLVCRKVEATGTRLGKRRVCAPAGVWAQREAHDQATMRALQRGRLEGETTKTQTQLDSALAASLRGI